jgi:hypothetical protein
MKITSWVLQNPAFEPLEPNHGQRNEEKGRRIHMIACNLPRTTNGPWSGQYSDGPANSMFSDDEFVRSGGWFWYILQPEA